MSLIEPMFVVAETTLPYLNDAELQQLWGRVRQSPCYGSRSVQEQGWIQLLEAVAHSNAESLQRAAVNLLQDGAVLSAKLHEYTLLAAMLGFIVQEDRAQALKVWRDYSSFVYAEQRPVLAARLLLALAATDAPEDFSRLLRAGMRAN
jgi:hypothetical protein